MPGFVPGIHVKRYDCTVFVDGRDEPGHDEANGIPSARTLL